MKLSHTLLKQTKIPPSIPKLLLFLTFPLHILWLSPTLQSSPHYPAHCISSVRLPSTYPVITAYSSLFNPILTTLLTIAALPPPSPFYIFTVSPVIAFPTPMSDSQLLIGTLPVPATVQLPHSYTTILFMPQSLFLASILWHLSPPLSCFYCLSLSLSLLQRYMHA